MKLRAVHFPQVDGSIGWVETSPYFRKRQLAVKNQSLEGDFDYAIIGAGFTGISLAFNLAKYEPDARILLLDALLVGQGSSGRNAGFIIDTPHALNGHDSADVSKMLYEMNLKGIEQLSYYQKKGSIDCHWQKSGKYLAAHEKDNERYLEDYAKVLSDLNIQYEMLNRDELSKKLGTSYYRSAIYTQDNILINPAALIQGMVDLLPDNISLIENTRLLSVDSSAEDIILETEKGTVKTHQLIYTNNGFLDEFGVAENSIVPCFTYASLTKIIPQELRDKYFKNVSSWGLTSAHPAGTTVRYTEDHRILIRNIFKYEDQKKVSHNQIQHAKKQHVKSLEDRFPFLDQNDFEYSWAGQVTLTKDLSPIFVKSQKNIYGIMSCNGVGVVRGTYLGAYMADLLMNKTSKELDFLLNEGKPKSLPPKIITKPIAKVRFAYEEYRAKGDI